MFNLTRASLDFLLQQVEIGVDYSRLANALDPSGLREVAGTNNNLVGSSVGTPGPFTPGVYASYGAADTEFLRLSQVSYDPDGLSGAYQFGIDHNGDSTITAADNNVVDANPRTVSLLVATSNADTNPAAAQAVADAADLGAYTDPDGTIHIPNAGVLGGGKYNGWLVAFGQFFDHGLDFIQKGGNGTVTIPLSPNDPQWIDPSSPEYIPGVSNVMRMARATLANPDSDFTNGVLNEGVTPIYNNNTAMLIDQSQTYGSHPGVNALLREYTSTGTPTGRVLAGDTELGPQTDAADTTYSKGLATWADLKLNATRIGVVLTDQDVTNAPMLKVDATGNLLFTPNGTQWTTAQYTGPADPSDPFVRDADGNVLRTNQAFIIDINPAADPNFLFDGPGYDAALLDAHFVAGDGRINENYMVTAVHNVFHEEHNYQVDNIKSAILAQADLSFLNQWLAAPVTEIPADPSTLQWDGNKLFQAARLITESEYNHIAIDQYVGALYGALPEFVSYTSDIDLGVSLEFSQAVFRLGHSMLNNTLSLLDPLSDPNNPTETVIGLMDGALNPTGFAATGAAEITLGLVRQTGDEIDEFLAPAMQNTLNGQVLDLAAIDLARGRDVGLPSLNELRQQIYDGLLQYTSNTNGGALAPYQNWADFGNHLRNPGTLVNMIAAYARGGDGGFGDAIASARAAYEAGTASLDDIRAAAQAVLDAYSDASDPQHAAAVQFMQGTPTYHSDTGTWTFEGANEGFWDVDLWIGGLAERPLFDGPLGTTFSYILLDFAQRMQDGDRFYYLYRTPMGTPLGDEVIANQFGDLVSRATGLEHLNGDVFIAADKYFFLDGSTSVAGQAPQLTNVDSDDDANDYFNEAFYFLDDGITPASGGHIVVVGGEGNDFIVGGLGDDTFWGDAGNDTLQGSQGNDHLYGGDGDDFITDDENDDFIRGGAGNDKIFAGPGVLDTVFGDEGDDEIHGGDGIDELIGGEGDDIIYGDGDTDVLFGEEGDDYLAGGDSVDELWGAAGNDWLRGGVGDDHLVGGDGNDLMEGGIGPSANDGDRLIGQGVIDFATATPPDIGFDVASYENVDIAIAADLQTSNANGTGALLDTYSGIDGLVGSRFNDMLTGAGPDTTTDNGINNLLVGGAGDDVLTGLGGDDIMVGDAVVVHDDFTVDGGSYTTVVNWRGTGESRPDFGGAIGLGYFLGDNGPAGAADKAVFDGSYADYLMEAITYKGYDAIRVTDLRDPTAAGFDGIDILIGMELAQFADRTVSLLNEAPLLDLHAFNLSNVADDFSPANYSGNDGSVNWASSWSETGDNNSSGSGQIRITGGQLRFTNGDGASIQRTVDLSGAALATLSFTVQENRLDNNNVNPALSEQVRVYFAADGTNFELIDTFNQRTNNAGTVTYTLSAPPGGFSGAAALRFEASGISSSQEFVNIDNVNIAIAAAVEDSSNDYSTTFTEDGPAVAIASGPMITDDGTEIHSARIVLTNAKPGDTLIENGIAGDGIIGSIDTSVPGEITLNLTGTASLAAYQNAIGAVRFNNGSQNPDTADRMVTVTVNDGLMESNVATATVHVLSANDAPNAVNDAIVTNIGTGSFDVPEWALLFNDSDPDSVLGITAVNESQSSFSVALAGDHVTVTKSTKSSRSFTYTASDGSLTDNASVSVATDTGSINAGSGNQIIVGDNSGTTIDAGTGNDLIFAGGGNDTIVWNANTFVTDGHDFVDGGEGTDTFTINGNNTAETYRLYARSDAIAAGITDLNADTEIVITRNATGSDSVIAELAGIEEIEINTSGGADTVLTIGDFTPTSLNFSTITVDGGTGSDIVDASGLISEHRIVLTPSSGHDVAVGGGGNDLFEFSSIADSPAGAGDIIFGFAGAQDRIDLSTIDADIRARGNQNFTFVGTEEFTSAGQLRYELVDTDADGVLDSTLIEANVNASLGPDLEILLQSYTGVLTAGDFIP